MNQPVSLKIRELLGAVAFAVAMVSSVHAELTDYKVVTWNLQGSSARTESKWDINIRQLISGAGAPNLVMVQEAGSPPSNAVDTGRLIGRGIPVRELIWQLGTNSRPVQVFIYFASLDALGGRVNLAIVSRRQADDVYVIPGPSVASRPALGIRLGQDAFFTVHALANQGSDAGGLVDAVFNFFRNQTSPTLQATNWMVAGDFNRAPDRLRMQIEAPAERVQVLDPGVPTQRSGGTLDYAVIGNAVGALPAGLEASNAFNLQRSSQMASDHFPVGISSSLPGARP